MTLSQRLTRAGLTFILFGSVAAVLPQQNNSAMADNPCTITTNMPFEIRQNNSATVSPNYTQADGTMVEYEVYFNGALDANGAFQTPTITGTATTTSAGMNTITVTTPTTGSGTVGLTATDTTTTSGTTYLATTTVAY